jgi:hypothetical protein
MGARFGKTWVVSEARAETQETVEHRKCNIEVAALGYINLGPNLL